MEHGPTRPDGSGPEFVLPHRGAVTEANWHVWQAEGVRPVPGFEAMTRDTTRVLHLLQKTSGTENVWTGDAFDLAEGRPLADKPGVGIYATEEGIQRIVQLERDFWQAAEGD